MTWLIPYRQQILFKDFFPTGWCCSVDWVLDWELKGLRFESQAGPVPGLWARSQSEELMCERQLGHITVSLPLLLPAFPSL